jgi:hypothetical protein
LSFVANPKTGTWEPLFLGTVGDLTDEHVGWYIEVADPRSVVGHRSFTLGKGIRRWEYPAGVHHVGLLDKSTAEGNCIGTERDYGPETAVKLMQPPKRRRRR